MSVAVARDGVRIPFVVDGDRRGGLLVFAHGLQGVGSRARDGVAPLIEAGWTIATFDQRGHGDATPILDPAGYDPVEMGADLWAVADAAGFERCWIGGGSMGAATSFRAATQHPERVRGLIQVCPAIANIAHPAIWLFDVLADTLKDGGVGALIAIQREFLLQLGASEDQLFLLEDYRRHDPASLEVALRAVPRWVFEDVPAAYSEFVFPVVVVCWDGDIIHPLQIGLDVAAAARTKPIMVALSSIQNDPTYVSRVLVDALERVRT